MESKNIDLNTFLRPEVATFAVLMETRLQAKDKQFGGDSWKVLDSITPLLAPLTAKMSKVLMAILTKGPDVLKQVTDVANYLMMLLDVLKKLK